MRNSDTFERLLHKALQTQDLPPIPASIQTPWLHGRADPGAKWVWLLPVMIFVLGLAIGSILAPLGLGSAFGSVATALSDIWRSVPENTLSWAGALLLGALIITIDSFRSLYCRLKSAKIARIWQNGGLG